MHKRVLNEDWLGDECRRTPSVQGSFSVCACACLKFPFAITLIHKFQHAVVDASKNSQKKNRWEGMFGGWVSAQFSVLSSRVLEGLRTEADVALTGQRETGTNTLCPCQIHTVHIVGPRSPGRNSISIFDFALNFTHRRFRFRFSFSCSGSFSTYAIHLQNDAEVGETRLDRTRLDSTQFDSTLLDSRSDFWIHMYIRTYLVNRSLQQSTDSSTSAASRKEATMTSQPHQAVPLTYINPSKCDRDEHRE